MRVNVLRVGKAAASGLLIAGAPAALGCAPDEAAEGGGEALDTSGDALNPGAATLMITDSTSNLFLFQSTTDEFLRVGEVINVTLPGWYLWTMLYPSEPVPSDVNRVKALSATLELRGFDKQTALAPRTFPAATWNAASDVWSLEATTGPLTIASKTDTIKFQLTLADSMNPAATVTLGPSQLPAAAVFAGELPRKSLLFDNVNGTKRQRVIEGDLIVAGAPLLFGVSDWRTEQIVDKLTINTQIGVAEAAGRFGWYSYPIHGTVQYEVAYGIDYHDGQGFRPEAVLAANPSSVLLPVGAMGRTVYEATLPVPSKSPRISMYLHVKAFLVADYTVYSNVTEQWYQQGSATLVRDSYDNPGGAFTNYELNLQK